MNIAIIPARGGSKRIPRKNIRNFHGAPLLKYSIEAARESGLFEKIIVTTDDHEIAEVAKSYKADVPFVRPAELSDDFTTTAEVVKHALEWMKNKGYNYEFSCTIYATAPFLEARYILEGYSALINSSAVSAFSATSSSFPMQRMFKINGEGRCEMFFPEYYSVRSQDLEASYHDAGQFYWSRIYRSSEALMFGKDSIPVILPRHLVQDIDTEEDWVRAELMYKVMQEAKVVI
ncbi:pseudaminic acid cytidylyltransferase [Pseudomonadales bacterium]|nr:pseudaminic acid cytidylyltransferase [Pseudomonadales bacterium]